MKNNTLNQFNQALSEDRALFARHEAYLSTLAAQSKDEIMAAIVSFAQEQGYHFSPSEFKAYCAQAKELADDALELSGGTRISETKKDLRDLLHTPYPYDTGDGVEHLPTPKDVFDRLYRDYLGGAKN